MIAALWDGGRSSLCTDCTATKLRLSLPGPDSSLTHFPPHPALWAYVSTTMTSLQKLSPDANTLSAPSTLYIPIASPPTPAPSPGPLTPHGDHNSLRVNTTHFPLVKNFQQFVYDPTHDFSSLDEQARLEYLNKILAQCTLRELSHVSTLISPRLKRDFLRELPTELALHILSYIDDLYDLVRNIAGVCKHWRRLSNDNWLWRLMCQRWEFVVPPYLQASDNVGTGNRLLVLSGTAKRYFKTLYLQRESIHLFPAFTATHPHPAQPVTSGMSWLHGGTPLRNHRLPISEPDTGVVTSLAMDEDWIVAGLSDSKIHVFSCRTGVLSRTLVGCEGGVWALWLVEKGTWSSPSPRKKNTTSGSAGWGQEASLVVSGGCDKVIRVWDVETGYGMLESILLLVSLHAPISGGACMPWKVTGRQSVALASSTIDRLPCRDLGILHLGSGKSAPDSFFACWKDISQASGVWTRMARLSSAGAMIPPVG